MHWIWSWLYLDSQLVFWFFALSQRSWGRGQAGDSYIVCVHLTSPNQWQREGRGMWEVWLLISCVFFFFLPVTPQAATSTKWLREKSLAVREDTKVTHPLLLKEFLPRCPSLILFPSYPQSYLIEWGSNFILISRCLDYEEPLLLDKTCLWVGGGRLEWCKEGQRRKDT